jgi:cell division cycle 2-like protein
MFFPLFQGCRNFNAHFEVLNSIDEGTYGVVYRAIDRTTRETVAVKKVKIHDAANMSTGFPLTSIREMNLLLALRHPNVISVREIAVGSKLSTVYMILDFEDHDVRALMNAMREPFQQAEVKCLMRQLLLGVQAMHANWIMHRDLKASNILYNNYGVLRICDLGMARKYGSPLEPYTEVWIPVDALVAMESELCKKLTRVLRFVFVDH